MATIYVVTAGEYSSYKIIGVYDNRADAETVYEALGDDIEEYELNARVEEARNNYRHFMVVMRREGHSRVFEVHTIEPLRWEKRPWGVTEMVFSCEAKGKHHAAKIANEKRAQLIAANAWPE